MHSGFPISARILAVVQDLLSSGDLQTCLQQAGHAVTLTCPGMEGSQLAAVEQFDLVLMDVSGPEADRLKALRQLRCRSRVPALLISTSGNEQERIAAFSQGADDYLHKPFNITELVARIQAILRRVAYERFPAPDAGGQDRLIFADHVEDVIFRGSPAGLTPSEYRVLNLLRQHENSVLSKPFLYQQALRRGYAQHDRSLDMHISHIRRKLKAIRYCAARLETIWGQGYLWAPLDDSDGSTRSDPRLPLETV